MGKILVLLTARNSFTDGLYLPCGDLATLQHVVVTAKIPRKMHVWKRLSGVETERKKCLCVPVLAAVHGCSFQPPEMCKDRVPSKANLGAVLTVDTAFFALCCLFPIGHCNF